MKKLFISADIEGTAGIVNWNETERSVPHDYDYFANQMTREVAAAIATKKKEDCMFPTSDKYHLEINFKEHFKAYEGGFYPGAKQTGSRTIEFECTDWLDAMRFLHFVL